VRPPAHSSARQLSLLGTLAAAAADTLDSDGHVSPDRLDGRASRGRTAEPTKRAMKMRDQPSEPSARRANRRRPRGTGAVFQKSDRWYGQWYLRGRLVKRSLGPVRVAGSRDGLTRTQAEARLRELMIEVDSAPPPVAERMTIAEVGDRRIKQLTRSGRKPDTTLANYESEIRIHFVPRFGEKPVDEITADDVEDFIDGCLDAEDRLDRGLGELSVKTVRNLYVHLNGIFELAVSKGWCHTNPCRQVDKPASPEDDDQEIRFLDATELDALLAAATTPVCRHTPGTLSRAAQARTLRDIERLEWKEIGERLGCSPATAIYLYRATSDAVLEDDLARVDRVLYLTAAMTGLRQGELLGLRWRDVDWAAQKVRVVHPYVRGKFRTPKSRTSSRAVPMADRVGRELELLFQASAYQAEDDLVFGHPHTGHPLERSQVSKRFKRALKRGSVREVRFHDLRHTFGTRCAAAGVPLRTLQAWMGHADIKTTMVYTHYAPGANEAELVNGVFQPEGINEGIKLSTTAHDAELQNSDEIRGSD
jgi:integrase